jgi:FKBP-type peptidyl-prolyl cis-trans isomerase SlyD
MRVIGFSYTLRDASGRMLDDSGADDPLYFLEGKDQIIPGLERELAGMEAGEKRRIVVSPDEAYGDHDPGLVVDVRRSQLPADSDPMVGDQLTISDEEAGPVLTILAIDGDTITLDGNHPMAGKELHFDVEIVAIRQATAAELEHGYAFGADGDPGR